MTHCMIDTETFGTRPGCVVRSIGAVLFDPRTGVMGESFYANLQLTAQIAVGLVAEKDVVEWWAGQSPEAQEVLLVDQRDPTAVCSEFRGWLHEHGVVHPWSHGKEFDLPIWEELDRRMTHWGEPPWKYYDTCDTRTVYIITGFDPRSIAREGTHHNALDDARHQVRCVAAALARQRQFHFQRGYHYRVREASIAACCPDEKDVHDF